MTQELIERLRGVDDQYCHTAADALEAQAAEIERLTLRLKMTSDTVNGYMLERDALQADIELLKQQKETMRLDYKELELQLTSDENIERDRDIYKEKADALQAKLDAAQAQEPQPTFGSKRKAAMAVYTPPFKYQHGYIFDASNLMVSDNGGIGDEQSVEGAVAARVRGWGRLGYLPNGAELQDEIGAMMADALNALYASPVVQQPPEPLIKFRHGCKWCGKAKCAEGCHGIGGQQP